MILSLMKVSNMRRDAPNAIVEYMPNAKYFAVRSSGAPFVKGKELIEDSSGVSLAGQYESYLEVPVEHISKAIMCCYASLFSPSEFSVRLM